HEPEGGSSCHSLSSIPWPRRRLKNVTTAPIRPAKSANRKNRFLPPFFSLSLRPILAPFAVGLDGLEPSTSSLSGMRSNQAELQARDEDGPSQPSLLAASRPSQYSRNGTNVMLALLFVPTCARRA